MSKLDPRLLAEVENAADSRDGAQDQGMVEIIVALRCQLDATVESALAARGLHLRSRLGDIVTGSARVKDLERIAAFDEVIAVEGGGSLFPDAVP